jgi:O-antigen/teichoic acid export membrane protein
MLLAYGTLIPWLGAVGAALATVIGFAVLMLLNWRTTSRIFPVRYEPGRLLALAGLLVLAWVVGLMIPVGWVTSPLKFLVWLTVPALSWQLGLISTGEKEYLAHIGQNLLNRWRRPGLSVRKMPPHPQADAA